MNKYKLPAPGEISPSAQQKFYLDFITEKQLVDEEKWALFIRAFAEKCDSDDIGWRGEYWGKMMRGACLVYRAGPDPKLYRVMEKAVCGLLAVQEADGRISSYRRDNEFSGWDMWCRKYVLTGMLHFYDICRDEDLKKRIIRAMIRHADYIISKIGEGKINITETSNWWLGVNSCSILEPFVNLYTVTKEKRYLDFAEYIISTGGIRGGNLIELALENKVMPFEYPENKAYETMSFFEGLLAYYEATGKEKYLTAVLNFVQAVEKTDITIIGSCGCTHELFDNSSEKQTEEAEIIMQETCVTVTLMRLFARLYLLTGDDRLAQQIEISAVNGLYGSVNLYDQSYTDKNGKTFAPLPFDSYSPLAFGRRGKGVGGLKIYDDGSFYGCCACIGAAGIGLYPLIDAIRKKKAEKPQLKLIYKNDKLAVTYGSTVFARDEAKCRENIRSAVKPLLEDGRPVCDFEKPEGNETVRLYLHTEDGKILLTDYASCGKYFADSKKLVTVWMNTAE